MSRKTPLSISKGAGAFLAFLSIMLLDAACADPKCPAGYMQYGNVCRRCKPGEVREHGQCVSIGDAGEPAVTSDSGANDSDDTEVDYHADADEGENPHGREASVADAEIALDSGIATDAQIDAHSALALADSAPLEAADSAPSEAAIPFVDPCTPNPCERAAACRNVPTGFSCECPSGSAGQLCELEICGDTTIRSDDDLRNSRLCEEIHGNLQIATSGLLSIETTDLPHLKKVTGDLRIAALNGSATTPVAQSMTFGNLETVEGTLFVGGTTPGSVQFLRFPALRTVGKAGDTALRVRFELAPDVKVLELPVLSTVQGSVSIAYVNRLCTLKLGAISQVTGDVSLRVLPNLPASTFAPLRAATRGTVSPQQVGCCFAVDNLSCEAFTAETRNTYCGC
jgi:hypothetical protein